MKAVFLFCIALFLHNCLFAQTNITGTIFNKQRPFREVASITISEKGSVEILAFTLSDEIGNYTLILNSTTDSLDIGVSHIGYASITERIPNKQQQINFNLQINEIKLPTVIVETKNAIRKIGDTLNYDVKTFTTKSDRVIGDIIRKLPGIEVGPNGQIKYNGKPISNYYIENLDLLEGRYNIANNNIPADMVDKVQVFENHQPIKALDSLVFSDKAALNIKLSSKAKNKFFTTAKLGIGISPILWDNELLGFNFRKGFQFISGYKTNNIGNNLQNEVNSFTNNQLDKLNSLNKKQDILSLINPATPQVEEKKYLFNKSHLIYTNGLCVLNKAMQLKFNLSYINNIFEKNATSASVYYLPQDTVSINEKQHYKIKNKQFLSDLGLTINNKKFFLKNNLKYEAYWSKEIGLTETPVNTLQHLENPLYQIINNFHLVVVKGKKATEINSNIIFKRMPQSLEISPGINSDIFNQSVPYDFLTQFATQKTAGADNSFAIRTRVLKFAQSLKIGLSYQNNTITSNIYKTTNTSLHEVADSFKNNLHWQEIKPYAELGLTLIKRGYSIEFVSSLQNITLIRDDKIRNVKNSTNHLFTNNSLIFKKDLGPYYTLIVLASNETSIGSINQNTMGYVLTTYRNISKNDFLLQLNKDYTSSLSLSYRNAIKALFGYFSLSYSYTKKNLLSSVVFTNQLETRESFSENNNQRKFFLFYNFNKYFHSSKTSISLRGNFNTTNFLQLQQKKVVTITNKSNSITLNLSSKKSNFIYTELNTTLSTYKSIFETENVINKTNSFTQVVENLNLNFSVTKNIIFIPSASYYFTAGPSTATNKYLFIDAGLIYKKGKYNIEFKVLNISNIKNFKTITSFDNIQTFNNYQLRPINALVQFYLKL